jgi:hypothetical protein
MSGSRLRNKFFPGWPTVFPDGQPLREALN